MQRRHFEFIAATVKGMAPDLRNAAAAAFADELRRTNPQFDRARFIAACGAEEVR